ncbi:hypothetical protein [Thalassobacillus sp. C254]|nr:hypothetical protein [Thalassobacillus sp. C254]
MKTIGQLYIVNNNWEMMSCHCKDGLPHHAVVRNHFNLHMVTVEDHLL